MIIRLSLHVFGMYFNRFQLVLAPGRAAVGVLTWKGFPRCWKETRSDSGDVGMLVVNALRGLPSSARIDVAFTDHWVRYLTFSVAVEALTLEEAQALARERYDALYPELRGEEWPIRIAAGTEAMLATRVDPNMLTMIKDGITTCGLRVGRLEPLLPYAMNREDTGLARHTGWWLLDEDDMVLCVQLKLGMPVGIHSQRGNSEAQAAMLLERQKALTGFDSHDVKVTGLFRCFDARLPPPWQSTTTPVLIDPSLKTDDAN